MSDQPTAADKATIRDFVNELERLGFCRKGHAARDVVLPFNRLDGLDYTHGDIEDRFEQWLKATNRACAFRNAQYITKCLPLIKCTKFKPGDRNAYCIDERTGTQYGNAWTWYEPTSDCADVSPLVAEFFERLAPDQQERLVLIQWLAHIFQRPRERPSWHIMIPSVPGTGKGFMLEKMLQPTLRHTMVISSYGQLLAQFSPVLESNLLILLDDCKSNSDSTQTRLKSVLSEERQYVERKHKDGGMVDCYARFILASNEDRPLYLEAGERRWFVLKKAVHAVDLWETQRFIQKLADWLALPGSLCKLYNWFMAVDLTTFNPKAVPTSDGLGLMVAMSKSPAASFIEGFIEDREVFVRTELTDALKQEDIRVSTNQLPHRLREAGYESTRLRLRHLGEQQWTCHPIGWTSTQVNAAFASRNAATVF